MLKNLSISNYAIIDKLSIDFTDGFTVITGETGAGKSIILGALMLITGERCDSKIVCRNEHKTIIEATFDMAHYNLKSFFEDNDWEYDEDECILRREILSTGRSRAFINDSPVSLSQMRLLSLRLMDIHSQNSNIHLGDASYQLQIIDSIADDKPLLHEYAIIYNEFCKLQRTISDLQMKVAAAKADEDYNKFQLSQFQELSLHEGEEEELEELQSKLANVAEIKNELWQICSSFDSENFSLISSLKSIKNHFVSIEPMLKDAGPLVGRLDSVIIELKDINATASELESSIEDNPVELDRVNERLEKIYDLKKKHNVATSSELLQLQKQLEDKIYAIDNGEQEISDLQKQLYITKEKLAKCAGDISKSRKKAALVFENELKELAKPLGMPNIQVKIDFQEIPFMKLGIDKIQFLISFNKNQSLMPLGTTASGGEISRIMLCVKTIVANRIKLPTVIFDEIDTGVSGEIANRMGYMMATIAKQMQVVTITHLPQVAALGDNHYKVFKKDTADTTITDVIKLSINDRISEIAGMLGGTRVDEAAINNAKSLLQISAQ